MIAEDSEVLDSATHVPGLYQSPLEQDLETFSSRITSSKIRSESDLEVLQNNFEEAAVVSSAVLPCFWSYAVV